MSAILTKTELISRTSTLLSGKPISALDPTNTVHVMLSDMYDLVLDTLLQKNPPWRFSVKTVDLSLDISTPIQQYFTNQFSLPGDLLLLWRIVPNIRYEIYGNKLLTNTNQLQADYSHRASVELFPSYFQTLLINQLAASTAMALTQQVDLVKYWENKAEEHYMRATIIDENQQMTNRVIYDPFVSAHQQGYSNGSYYNWSV